jgi:nicotinamidase/pyrazinamidase
MESRESGALNRIIFWEVDAQVDFMLPGGKLYVPGAEKIIPNINCLVDRARAGRVLLISYQQIVLEKQALDVFTNPHAGELVQALGPHIEYVVFGVATEFCVWCTVKGLLQRGVKVQIVRDAIETITFEQGEAALAAMRALGARLLSTDQAIAMADGHTP